MSRYDTKASRLHGPMNTGLQEFLFKKKLENSGFDLSLFDRLCIDSTLHFPENWENFNTHIDEESELGLKLNWI